MADLSIEVWDGIGSEDYGIGKNKFHGQTLLRPTNPEKYDFVAKKSGSIFLYNKFPYIPYTQVRGLKAGELIVHNGTEYFFAKFLPDGNAAVYLNNNG